MQLKQITIRPADHKVIIQYTDNAGRIGNLTFDSTNDTTVNTLISQSQARVPAEQNRPDRPQIEQEIEQLEDRLEQLRQSIGQP
jgi:hypothetical protein